MKHSFSASHFKWIAPFVMISLSWIGINSAHAQGLLSAQSADSSSPHLTRAHAAYLSGDFRTMAVEIRDAIQAAPHDSLILRNAMDLLNQAYRIRGSDGIPVDWHLPEDITRMKVGVRLTQRDLPSYTLKVQGNIARAGIIRQLRVTRFPDQIVADKQAGVGEWEEEPGRNGEDPEYGLSSVPTRTMVSSGLYLLHVELTDGRSVDGWFLLDDRLNSTASPQVSAPQPGQTFTTATPTFYWNDFRSPEYQNGERRSVWMGLSRSEPPQYNWDLRWEQYADSPHLTRATITPALEPGRYIFVIKYSERRRFGDLLIGRDSVTTRPLVIRPN